MNELSEDRSAGPPSRHARSALADAALTAVQRCGGWAIMQSRSRLLRCAAISDSEQEHLANAVTNLGLRRPVERGMANRSDRHLPNLSTVQGPF
jgi:hypothetical protein